MRVSRFRYERFHQFEYKFHKNFVYYEYVYLCMHEGFLLPLVPIICVTTALLINKQLGHNYKLSVI